DALAQALKNPLMDKGKMLVDAANVLVQVAGGPAMTLSEVEILMKELGKHVRDHTQIIFGTAVDNRMGNRLSVTIISSLQPDVDLAAQPEPVEAIETEPVAPPAPIWEQPAEPEPKIDIEPEPFVASAPLPPEDLIPFEPPVSIEAKITPAPEPKKTPTGPRLIVPKKKPLPLKLPAVPPAPVKQPKPVGEKAHAKQEVLQFEPVTRGRFEKSEPTIVEGQDLDVPTFLRKNVRVK
ncbi:MAG: hypothetical protein ABJB69_11085, partial [Spartobacteria bacterium]